MRHRKKTVKLGRTAEHRNALLANQTLSLIEHGRIKTTLAKAKAVRPFAEKIVTLAKRGGLHARRTALALLHNNSTRTVKAVGKLFTEIGPRNATRNGGYTRIVKLGQRLSDSAPMAFIEWVDAPIIVEETPAVETAKPAKAAKAPKAEKAEQAPAETAEAAPKSAE